MVRTQCFKHCGPGLIPGLGTEIPHQATGHCGQKKIFLIKKKKKSGPGVPWRPSGLRIQHCHCGGSGSCLPWELPDVTGVPEK